MKSVYLLFCISLFNFFHSSLRSSHETPPPDSSESEEKFLEEIIIHYFLYNKKFNISPETIHKSIMNADSPKDFPDQREYVLKHAKPILEKFNIKTINDFTLHKSTTLFHIVKRILNETCTTNFRDDFTKFCTQKKAISLIKQLLENKKDKADILIQRLESGSPYSNADVIIWSETISTLESYLELPEVVEAMTRALSSRVESIRKEARQVLRKNRPTQDIPSLHDYCIDKIDITIMIQTMEKLEPRIRKIILTHIFNSFKENISKICDQDLALFRRFDQDALSELLVARYEANQYGSVISIFAMLTELKQLEKYRALASLLHVASNRGDDEFFREFFEIIDISEAIKHQIAIAGTLASFMEKTTSLKVCNTAFSILHSLENSEDLTYGITAGLENTNGDIRTWTMNKILKTQLSTESKLVLDIIYALYTCLNAENQINDHNLIYKALMHIINHSEQFKNDFKKYKPGMEFIYNTHQTMTFNDAAYFFIGKVKRVFYKSNIFNNEDLLNKNIEIIKSLNIEGYCLKHIFRHLKNDEKNIRTKAINALRMLSYEEKREEIIEIVRDTLKNENDAAVRDELQKYLHELGGDSWCIIS